MDDNVESRLSLKALEYKLSGIKKLSSKQLKKNKNTYTLGGLTIDISRNFLNQEVLNDLFLLAKNLNLKKNITKLANNQYYSISEAKKVSHLYLRNSSSFKSSLGKMLKLYDLFIKRDTNPSKIKKVEYVIVVGIGGSIAGSKLLSQALSNYKINNLKTFYISSADTTEIDDALKECVLSKTLFIFCSKSFKTQEVILNLKYIREEALKEIDKTHLKDNFIAITSFKDAALKMGFKNSRILSFSNNIPGRFSLTSSIIFPVLLEIGKSNIKKFFDGVKLMDKHFCKKKYEDNIPVILSLISVWNINFLYKNTLCVCPYNYRLRNFADYLQQQEMESNGKSTDIQGNKIPFATSPIIFGQRGTECQHSFFQMIHQGHVDISVDFIAALESKNNSSIKFLLSNLLAQAELCFSGKNTQKLYKKINGGTSSNIILLDSVNPETIGSLLSMYEHKIFTEGLLWNINSFDQWGVEEGKISAKKILNIIKKKKDLKKISKVLESLSKNTK